MATPNSKFTTKVIKLDSFLFQKRRFFERDGFTWDWSYFCDRDILADLKFQLEKVADGASLRFKHRTAVDGVAFHYRVALDQTPSHNGSRFWFCCPCSGADGRPCGGRVRCLYLRRGQGVFACERCAGLKRERNQRSRNMLHRDFLWPAQQLQEAMIQLLRCRSPKKQAFLRDKIQTYREKIAAFSDTWIKIAARILTGRAGVRDRQRFNELFSRLLGPEMGVFPNDDLEDRSGRNAANNTMTLSALLDDLEEGFRELLKTPYSEVFREATTDPPEAVNVGDGSNRDATYKPPPQMEFEGRRERTSLTIRRESCVSAPPPTGPRGIPQALPRGISEGAGAGSTHPLQTLSMNPQKISRFPPSYTRPRPRTNRRSFGLNHRRFRVLNL